MICPACRFDNIAGEDICENCGEDLAALDGIASRSGIERSLIEDPISRLSPKQAIVVERKTSVMEAVRKMNNGRMGCVVVAEEGKVVGILTERDVLYKLLGKRKDLSRIQVGTVMTSPPETLGSEDSIAYALNKMAVGGFRHVPIVTDRAPPAIISIRDILRYITEHVQAHSS